MGFSVDATASTKFTTIATWLDLPKFDTSNDRFVTTFVREGTSFDGTQFTVPTAGIYIATFNIRLDDISTGWVHTVLRPSTGFNLNNGMSTLRGSANYKEFTFSNMGIISAAANVKYSVAVGAAADKDFTFHDDSSFAMYKIEPTEGVYARANPMALTGTGWQTLTSWVTTSSYSFQSIGGFASGQYTVKESGIFIVGATIRFNGIASTTNSFVRAVVTTNGNRALTNAMHSIDGESSTTCNA